MYRTKRKIKKAFTPITIANTPYTKNKDQIQINNIEAEIEETERLHQKGAMIRSRTKLIENEEKPTKFFYTAGKQNKNKKNITQLKNKKKRIKKKRWGNTQNSKRLLLRAIYKSTNKGTRTRKFS